MSRHIEMVTPDIDTLIPNYAEHKSELDAIKKVCDTENSQIKECLTEIGTDTYEVNGYRAKKSVQERESINEDMLLAIVKKHNIPGVVKTKEYVDADALESYLYSVGATPEFAADFEKCKSVTEVVQLRVTKLKKKDEEE